MPPQLGENKILICPILRGSKTAHWNVFHPVLMLWYTYAASVNSVVSVLSATLIWVSIPHLGESRAFIGPRLVNNIMVVQRDARLVVLFGCPSVFKSSLLFIFPLSFHALAYSQSMGLSLLICTLQTGSSLALKYKASFWRDIIKC